MIQRVSTTCTYAEPRRKQIQTLGYIDFQGKVSKLLIHYAKIRKVSYLFLVLHTIPIL